MILNLYDIFHQIGRPCHGMLIDLCLGARRRSDSEFDSFVGRNTSIAVWDAFGAVTTEHRIADGTRISSPADQERKGLVFSLSRIQSISSKSFTRMSVLFWRAAGHCSRPLFPAVPDSSTSAMAADQTFSRSHSLSHAPAATISHTYRPCSGAQLRSHIGFFTQNVDPITGRLAYGIPCHFHQHVLLFVAAGGYDELQNQRQNSAATCRCTKNRRIMRGGFRDSFLHCSCVLT